jgi:enoyl-CoA hydratase/carnithine racemase
VIVAADEGAVRLLTFDRPEARNAFDRSMYLALTGALEAAAADDGVHVVVLTGRPPAFSAGQDLKEMAALVSGEADPDAAKGFRGLMDALCEFDKPLLAAVNGVGVGLGFTMLAHCDIVLVSDEARLRVPFAELGVPAEAASSYLFPLRMGSQRAAEVLFTGGWVDAEEAVRCGIALRRVAPEALVPETMALAHRIAAGSPEALRVIKGLVLAAHADAVAAARGREDEAFARLLGSAANTAALDRFESTGRLR